MRTVTFDTMSKEASLNMCLVGGLIPTYSAFQVARVVGGLSDR